MAYQQTKNLKLDKIGDDNIFDPNVITGNFEKVDEAFGKIKPDTKDTDVTCTARSNKKLNEVLRELFSDEGKAVIRSFNVEDDGAIKITVGDSDSRTFTQIKNLILTEKNAIEGLQTKTNSIETELNGKVDRLEVANERITKEISELTRLIG